jgi:hypothetical protein
LGKNNLSAAFLSEPDRTVDLPVFGTDCGSSPLHTRLVDRKAGPMDDYLKEVAAKVLRLSRSTMDIGTGRRLRELAEELNEKADEYGDDPARFAGNCMNYTGA